VSRLPCVGRQQSHESNARDDSLTRFRSLRSLTRVSQLYLRTLLVPQGMRIRSHAIKKIDWSHVPLAWFLLEYRKWFANALVLIYYTTRISLKTWGSWQSFKGSPRTFHRLHAFTSSLDWSSKYFLCRLWMDRVITLVSWRAIENRWWLKLS